MKKFLSAFPSVLYFVAVMWWVVLLLLITPFMLIGDIGTVHESGFSSNNIGLSFMGIFGLLIGVSLLIPAFRRMYYKLPWLFPFVKIFLVNVVILTIAELVLNYGYEVRNDARHMLFFILTLGVIVIGRVIMSVYFSRKKVEYIGGGKDE